MTTKYKFHPACELFPLVGKSELKKLADNIKKDGLRFPIVLDKNDASVVVEGRNRFLACKRVNVEPQFVRCPDDDPTAFIISANIHRRHLTAKQKRDLIAKLLKANPEKSDRQIGETVKASHVTVAKERRKAEASGQIVHIKHPKARKTPNKSKPKSVQLAEAYLGKEKAKAAVNAKDPPKLSPSEKALREFKIACETWLPKLDANDLEAASAFFAQQVARHHNRVNGSAEIPEGVRREQTEMIAEKASA